jgi:hypothetical protein
VPYCHLWPASLYNIFAHYLIHGITFFNNNDDDDDDDDDDNNNNNMVNIQC